MVMVFFDKTLRSGMDLALTRGNSPFSIKTLEKINTQTKQFSKLKFNYTGLSLIPLAIIAFLVLKK